MTPAFFLPALLFNSPVINASTVVPVFIRRPGIAFSSTGRLSPPITWLQDGRCSRIEFA
jgi:hypothetical protein